MALLFLHISLCKANCRECQHFIRFKILPRPPLKEIDCLAGCIQHVMQENPVIFRHTGFQPLAGPFPEISAQELRCVAFHPSAQES